MSFLEKMEKKYRKNAIPNLIVYVLAAYAIGYMLTIVNPRVYTYLLLDPELICKGQVWRLFTWVCTVPQELSIFLIFMFMFYYWIGKTLENTFGSFRYNVFIFSGYLLMTVGTMAIYLISGVATGFEAPINLNFMTTYYLNMVSFLAFAVLYPDMEVNFMMILPIKVKWLAVADGVYMAYEALRAAKFTFDLRSIPGYRDIGLSMFLSIVFPVINFVVFFYATKMFRGFSPSGMRRKREYKKQTKMRPNVTKHKCAICGRTEDMDDTLVFRFCSKCNGNYEYCQEHLFTHEHKK